MTENKKEETLLGRSSCFFDFAISFGHMQKLMNLLTGIEVASMSSRSFIGTVKTTNIL
jgi:hypothetical protein